MPSWAFGFRLKADDAIHSRKNKTLAYNFRISKIQFDRISPSRNRDERFQFIEILCFRK